MITGGRQSYGFGTCSITDRVAASRRLSRTDVGRGAGGKVGLVAFISFLIYVCTAWHPGLLGAPAMASGRMRG